MAIVRWDPFGSHSFWRWPLAWEGDEDEAVAPSGRGLDVYEAGDEIVVKASVAGVKPENVDVTFEDDVLWIRGEEQQEEKEDDKRYYRKSSRTYSYKVAVPGNVDPKTEPKAEIEDGVMVVRFKKTEEVKPKKINVKVKGKE